jgi:hypothetical protein
MTPRTWSARCLTALLIAFALASAWPVAAQAREGRGLVIAVDPGNGTLLLDTASGPQRVRVAPAATIVGDHDQALTLIEVAPGDAVSYQLGSDHATSLRVASHFWAVPGER